LLLSRTGKYLAQQIRAGEASLEEQLLALRALRIIRSAWTILDEVVPDIHEFQSTLDQRTWTSTEGVRLVDRPVVVHRQPIWYSIIWRPLLYLAVRGSSPTSPLQALLGHELVSTFNGGIKAWHGPSGASSAPQGVSWASALALRTTYALAQDLLRFGITADEWFRRSHDLADEQYDFDVAISFAGSDRTVASQISDELKRAGYRVFYDRDYQHALLGEDLTEYLQQTYSRRSRFAIVIISTAFKESKWAGQWEWKAVLARMQDQQGAYLLPYIVEDIDLPGLNKTIGYVNYTDYAPMQFANLVIRKLRETG
jgi:TIR domain